jgi:hypothetical protein
VPFKFDLYRYSLDGRPVYALRHAPTSEERLRAVREAREDEKKQRWAAEEEVRVGYHFFFFLFAGTETNCIERNHQLAKIDAVAYHFSPRYFAVNTHVDDSQDGPRTNLVPRASDEPT